MLLPVIYGSRSRPRREYSTLRGMVCSHNEGRGKLGEVSLKNLQYLDCETPDAGRETGVCVGYQILREDNSATWVAGISSGYGEMCRSMSICCMAIANGCFPSWMSLGEATPPHYRSKANARHPARNFLSAFQKRLLYPRTEDSRVNAGFCLQNTLGTIIQVESAGTPPKSTETTVISPPTLPRVNMVRAATSTTARGGENAVEAR